MWYSAQVKYWRLGWWGVGGLALLALVASVWAVLDWADGVARSETDLTAQANASGDAGLLASELQKFRLLPLVLVEYPDVRGVLAGGGAPVARRLNERLELFARRTDAAAIYVIASDGTTVAASNWQLPTSFVGQDYGFRPYFRQSLARGAAEMFALGTISGRPGLFIARRVETGGRTLGVIVVKVEFDALEAGWARQPGVSFVTDGHGVVTITSRPDWRFRAIAPLSAATRAQIRATAQFGDLPLTPLPLIRQPNAVRIDGSDARFRIAHTSVPLAGAQLWRLEPLEPEEARATANARTILLGAAALVALAIASWWRVRVRRRALEEAREALEAEVEARTADLSAANAGLLRESQERRAADRRFRKAREELAHANRLGSIGQITAGVTHEINQPVAAIRTFAENAGLFLERGKGDQARANLHQIVGLTERIGRITGELRTFARRGTPAQGTVVITDVIDGALLLIGDRIAGAGIELVRAGDSNGVAVVADRIRLEQVLINLLQNAVEALDAIGGAQIRLVAEARDDDVVIEVIDNGPGIAPEVVETLFTPFTTGKPDGLGLGLGIARDIVREFGGTLTTIASPLGGAGFRVTLRRA